jgi:hypothetical protein
MSSVASSEIRAVHGNDLRIGRALQHRFIRAAKDDCRSRERPGDALTFRRVAVQFPEYWREQIPIDVIAVCDHRMPVSAASA